jgi:TetR/AcrR family transcriptional repressor of nem operon
MSKASQADAARHRNEIVDATSRTLRERGAAGVSVQEAMAAAGLTHGGFYRHFGSREDLIGAAASEAFSGILALLDRIASESPDRRAARTRIFDEYLTPEHRDSPGAGCGNAALAADAARIPDSPLHAAYVDGLKATIARLELSEDEPATHRQALEHLIILVGGLTLARATAGDPLSDEFLDVARESLTRR